MSDALKYLFWLAVLLIVVAYFAGASTLGQTIINGLNQLGLTFTGRNAQGQFAAYPGNAPSVGTVTQGQSVVTI